MNYGSVQAALDSRLADWADGQGLDVAWQNAPYTPTVGTTHLAAHFLGGNSTNQIGSEHAWLSGVYQVDVIYPPSTGTGSARQIADSVAGLFKAGTLCTSGTTRVSIRRTSRALSLSQSGTWRKIPLTFYWGSFQAN